MGTPSTLSTSGCVARAFLPQRYLDTRDLAHFNSAAITRTNARATGDKPPCGDTFRPFSHRILLILCVYLFPPSLCLQTTQFVKLARDTQIVGTALSEADPPLTDADVQVVYTAEVKNRDRAPGAAAARNGGMAARSAAAVSASAELKKMNYNDFLTALMKLSIRVYPRSRSVDEAFQRLLMDNILPLASR